MKKYLKFVIQLGLCRMMVGSLSFPIMDRFHLFRETPADPLAIRCMPTGVMGYLRRWVSVCKGKRLLLYLFLLASQLRRSATLVDKIW